MTLVILEPCGRTSETTVFFKKMAVFFEKMMSFSRFPQILHNNLHFLFQKRVAVLVVPHSRQFGHEGFIPSHPAIECLEGGRALTVRTV
jgi:hypothetical protein